MEPDGSITRGWAQDDLGDVWIREESTQTLARRQLTEKVDVELKEYASLRQKVAQEETFRQYQDALERTRTAGIDSQKSPDV